MGFFNPVTYFFKYLIRFLTRKFVFLVIFLIGLFLGFILFGNNVVFGANYSYSYYQSDNEFYCSMDDEQLACLKEIPEFSNENVSAFSFYRNSTTVVVAFFNSYSGAFAVYRTPNIIDFPVSAGQFRQYYITYSNNAWHLNSTTPNVYSYSQWSWDNFVVNGKYFFKNMRVAIDWVLPDEYIQHYTPVFINPSIVNTTTDVNSFNYEKLIINLNSASAPSSSLKTILNIQYNVQSENQFSIDVSQYFSPSSNTIEIPRVEILKNMILSTSFDMTYTLLYADNGGNIVDSYSLGHYTISLTQDSVDNLMALSNQDTQNNIEDNTDKTSQGIENINNSITNSDIEDINSNTLPSDNTTDITSDGVNGIFTSIYNAFCTGNAVDIVFPFPFTNKSITLSPTYVRDNLTAINASFVITLIEAFWWYLISRFIIKDVMNKINKIKSGNVEDIETTNIRGDML